MKMETINISVTAEMAEYARRQAGALYGNVSEFFRELLRQRIQADIEKDVKEFEELSKGAFDRDPDAEELEMIQEATKKARAKRLGKPAASVRRG